MFTKLLATATTLLVGVALSLTAVAGSASASPSIDAPVSAPAVAPAVVPAVVPTVVPTVVPAVVRVAPTAVCIPNSSVSYTYVRASNSGDITVTDVADSTGLLCHPFWVTATSWLYTSTARWPQLRDVVQKLPKISTPGVYHYAASVTCGQGDIYASTTSQPDPTVTLTAPGVPFEERFLFGMGFAGPTPTYMEQGTACNVITPVAPTATVITACGTYGTVSVPADTANTTYSVTGTGNQGDYVVTATVKSPYRLASGATTAWTFHLGRYTPCIVAVVLTITPLPPKITTALGCDAVGVYNLPAQNGVTWTVDGAAAVSGSHSVTSGRVIHIVAMPLNSTWRFAAGSTSAWTLSFTDPVDCGGFPTLSVQPVNVTSTAAACDAGVPRQGTITVGQVDGVDFTPFVAYAIDGVAVTNVTTAVGAGTHVVTASAKIAGDTLEQGPNTLSDGSALWTIVIPAATATALCGDPSGAELKTLALTGTGDGGWGVIALILLQLGVALCATQFVRGRRARKNPAS